MVIINNKWICAYDINKPPQEIRKMWDDGLLNPDGHHGDFATHVVYEIHHYTHKESESQTGGWCGMPSQDWVNETLGIKYRMTMMTGSHYEILDDKLTPTFQTKSMEELEKLFPDV